MPTWIALAIAAQLLGAVVVFVDRYVLTQKKGMGLPVVYAFYVSLLSGVVIVLLPFGLVSVPSLLILELSLVSAASFITSLLLLYSALRAGHASDVMPVVAAFSALASFTLAFLWLSEHLPGFFLASVALFILGTFLISRFRFTKHQLVLVVSAGLLFGFSAFLIKVMFVHASFWDGFFWSRMANVTGALLLLVWPGNWKAIMHGTRSSSHGTKWLIIGNKALAGIAGAVTFFAIGIGSVTVVNAMGGLQFVFLPVLAFLFAHQFPNVLRGEVFHSGISHKLLGVVCIVLGLAFLYVA
ncbi:MAG: hypothetical protein Q7S50_02230 [bacterium]|nr:hypothetical protein [bacterium]